MSAAMRRLLLLLPLAVALAACGSPKPYALAKTRACLEKKGLRLETVTARVDFVASTASQGALRADFPHYEVTISLGADAAEAERLATAYSTFHGKNIGIE